MPKVNQKHSYDNFLKELTKISIERRGWSKTYHNVSSIYDYWDSCSLAERKRIISFKSWNYYPTEVYGLKPRTPKVYGPILWDLIRYRILHSTEDKKLLIRHSEGLIALIAFEYVSAKEKIRMAKRLITSKDKRLKNRAASILPINQIRSALNDSDWSVRNKAIKRIGFENCYKEFIPESLLSLPSTYRLWHTRQAMNMATYEEVKHLIDELDDNVSDWIAAALISKIPKDKILYHIDKQNIGSQTSKIIQMIMGIRPKEDF